MIKIGLLTLAIAVPAFAQAPLPQKAAWTKIEAFKDLEYMSVKDPAGKEVIISRKLKDLSIDVNNIISHNEKSDEGIVVVYTIPFKVKVVIEGQQAPQDAAQRDREMLGTLTWHAQRIGKAEITTYAAGTKIPTDNKVLTEKIADDDLEQTLKLEIARCLKDVIENNTDSTVINAIIEKTKKK